MYCMCYVQPAASSQHPAPSNQQHSMQRRALAADVSRREVAGSGLADDWVQSRDDKGAKSQDLEDPDGPDGPYRPGHVELQHGRMFSG